MKYNILSICILCSLILFSGVSGITVVYNQQPNLNLIIETNPTYLINVSSPGIVNATSFIFYHGVNDTNLDSMKIQYRYPASTKQPEKLRACNRNESLTLLEDNAIRYDGDSDIWSFGGHLYGTHIIPTIESRAIDDSWIEFNLTHDYHNILSYHVPVDRTLLHSEDKTGQYITIYKSRPAMIELESFPIIANVTVHLELNIDDYNSTYPLSFYACNNSVSPYTVDYTTDHNCGFWGTKLNFDTKDKVTRNSSYVHTYWGVDNDTLLNVNGNGIVPTDRLYIYMATEEPISTNGYRLYYADDNTPADLVDFDDTYYLNTYSPPSWTNNSETPDVQFQIARDTYTLMYYIHVCNNTGDCINDSIQFDSLGDRPNVAPSAPQLIQPLGGEIISGQYNITWIDGIDPEDNPFNITIYLFYDETLRATIADNNITQGTEYFEFNTSQYGDGTKYKISITACDDLGLCSENISSISNFKIDNIEDTYYDQEYKDQGLHWWIFCTMLILIIGSLIGLYSTHDPVFGVIAGVLMIVLAALIFNGIFYDVCDVVRSSETVTGSYTNMTYEKSCYTQDLSVPYWFTYLMQSLLIAFGGLAFIYSASEYIQNIKEKREDD